MNSMAAAIVAQSVDPDDHGDEPTAKAIAGAKGGLAAASKLTPQQRSERARKAAQARWSDES